MGALLIQDAVYFNREPRITVAHQQAANAGGVAVSGLEMAQNSGRVHWTRAEVDQKLKAIMQNIYVTSRDTAAELGHPGGFPLISADNRRL